MRAITGASTSAHFFTRHVGIGSREQLDEDDLDIRVSICCTETAENSSKAARQFEQVALLLEKSADRNSLAIFSIFSVKKTLRNVMPTAHQFHRWREVYQWMMAC